MVERRWYWLGLLASLSLLATAYFYFQLELGLDPCPLCMFQRACLVGIAAMCLAGLIFRPGRFGAKLLAFFGTIFSVLGVAIAGRQVWLQHLPEDKVPECGPGLDFMLEVMPFQEIIKTVLTGSGECAEVHPVLGIGMATWMVFIFIVMTVVCVKLLFKKERSYFSGALGK